MDRWYLENVMPEVLKMVDDYVESSKIEVKTMGELAEGYKDLTAVKRK
jgi:hypothetical protein